MNEKLHRREGAASRIQKHPAAVAWDAFEEKNRSLFDLSTIGTSPQYLRNRIMHAFMDGWDAALKVGEKTALDVVDAACARSAHNGEAK